MDYAHKKIFKPAVIALGVSMLMACGSGGGGGNDNGHGHGPGPVDEADVGGGDTSGIMTVRLNATAGGLGAAPGDPENKFTYFSLKTGKVIDISDEDSKSSTDWDIAFKRTNIKLNGGVSGPGDVQGAVADSQDEYYDDSGDANTSVFLNATAANELASIQAVSAVSDLDFESDRNIAAIVGGYGDQSMWSYDPLTHKVSAVPERWFVVRSAGGDSYAKLHATNLVRTATRDITLELFVQGVGESAFSATALTPTFSLPLAGGAVCYDFDTNTNLDCSDHNWDIKVEYADRMYNVWTNGGVSGAGEGAALGPVSDIDSYVSGTLLSSGRDYSAMYRKDSVGGVFVDNSWYEYGLQGAHKLWPNYRVYAIKDSDHEYALQILSFYDEAGTSGMISFRYKPL